MSIDLLDNPEAELLEHAEVETKVPRAAAIEVAREILGAIATSCARVLVAGSLRRGKAMVGDVEIIYIPCTAPGLRTDLLAEPELVSLVDPVLERLMLDGRLARRLNTKGAATWGAKNKLAVHVASGIAVDLFAATRENWWNYIVCLTGGAKSNVQICNAARAKGWKWNPYGAGFSRPAGLGRETHAVQSEREVFEFVGLPYLEPRERE